MKLHLTDGKSKMIFFINRDQDAKDWDAVVRSARPVTKAFDIIKKRIRDEQVALGATATEAAEFVKGLWPAPGVALEGHA